MEVSDEINKSIKDIRSNILSKFTGSFKDYDFSSLSTYYDIKFDIDKEVKALNEEIEVNYAYIDIDNRSIKKIKDEKELNSSLIQAAVTDASNTVHDTLSTMRDKLDGLALEKSMKPEEIERMVKGMLDSIMQLLNPFYSIGFPNIPLIGDLNTMIMELDKIDKVTQNLPEEAKKSLDENEDDDSLNFDFSKIELEVSLIKKDVLKILEQLKTPHLYALNLAILVLVDAVKQIFDKVGLGTFDFDNLLSIKGSGLSLSFDVDFLNFEPPKNILEAIPIALPMITKMVQEFPSMITKQFYNKVKMITKLKDAVNVNDYAKDALLSAFYQDRLSCEKLIEYDNKQLDVYNSVYAINSGTKTISENKNILNKIKNKGEDAENEDKVNEKELNKSIDKEKERIEKLKKEIDKIEASIKEMRDKASGDGFYYEYDALNESSKMSSYVKINLKEYKDDLSKKVIDNFTAAIE